MSEQDTQENGSASPDPEQHDDITANSNERQSECEDEEWMEGCFHTFLALFWMLCALLTAVAIVYFVMYVYKESHWSVRVLVAIAGTIVGAGFYGLAY
ncbi:MAG: hypothetical protein ACW98F_20530, partial [Candidatus Hodarchaeales archaeon]